MVQYILSILSNNFKLPLDFKWIQLALECEYISKMDKNTEFFVYFF